MAQTGNFAHSNRTDLGETSYQKIPSDPTDNGRYEFRISSPTNRFSSQVQHRSFIGIVKNRIIPFIIPARHCISLN